MGTIASGMSPRRRAQPARERDRALRADRRVPERRALDVERDPVEGAAGLRPEREHRRGAARVEGGLQVAGQVPRDRPEPARMQRVDEAAELGGLDDVGASRCSSRSRSRPSGCRARPCAAPSARVPRTRRRRRCPPTFRAPLKTDASACSMRARWPRRRRRRRTSARGRRRRRARLRGYGPCCEDGVNAELESGLART